MKTTKLLLIASIALAFTFSASFASAAEKGSARGGAADLIRPAPPASEVTPVVAMECPKCKSEWLVKTDLTARGATKPTYATEKHLCSKCSTELTLVGIGKSAKNLPIHLCSACIAK